MNLIQKLKKNLTSGSYPPLLYTISEKELSLIAHAKRFIERHNADPEFRKIAESNPREAAKKYKINIDPEKIRPMWDPVASKQLKAHKFPINPLLKLCLEYDKSLVKWVNQRQSEETIINANFEAWRNRQSARGKSELGIIVNAKIGHAPACFELSSGCTVGCWFCAISADQFSGNFTYNPENEFLWKEVLKVIYDITGPAAGSGLCYWATDPFDNPDYEKFILDFYNIIGHFPVTLTAQAQKNIPRTKSLLRMWEDHGFTCNRLSIMTVKILDQIHEAFTPEELVWTALNLVNKGSVVKKAKAGRVLEKIKKLSGNGREEQETSADPAQGTIACISGFKFNMLDKKVSLISPCKANDRWPEGYKIFEEGTFTCGEDLKPLLMSMIETHMPLTIRNDDIVKFRPDLKYRQIDFGFELATEYLGQKIENQCYGLELGNMIHKGTYKMNEIVERITQLGATPREIRASINALFKNGLLDH